MPGGFLSQYFGPKRVVLATMIISIAMTVLTPYAAKWNFFVCYAARFFIGFVGAPVLPCLHHLIANWIPPTEKGRYLTLIEGTTLAVVVTWQVVGVLMKYIGYTWGGFHVPAIFAIIIALMWQYIVYDSPDQHPRIRPDEKAFIAEALKGKVTGAGGVPPFKAIMTSLPFLALIGLHYGSQWTFFFYVTSIPKFMSEVLGFSLSTTGLLSAIPTLMKVVWGIIFAAIGDVLRKRQTFPLGKIRKYFTIVCK